jgi:hypothetical protein
MKAMADQNILHTAEIMKAALPYIDSRTRIMAEFFIKLIELMGSLSILTNPTSLAACGYQNEKINVEGLLTSIRPLCSNKERDMVDKILGIFNAKRMFEMYNNFMSTMNTMQEFAGFPSGDASQGEEAAGNGFSGFNFDSIFGNSATTNDSSEQNTNSFSDSSEQKQEKASDDKQGSDSPTGNNGNDAMFEMLKSMVPPEQLSTFENLSMLFKTMSYDNNKPDDSKEN